MDTLQTKLLTFAKNNLNVLLIGSHGIGKSYRVFEISKELKLKFKYYSSPTLDPFVDIVGIPVPDKENKICEFFRSKEIEDAEFIFFDELNRAHPKVLNAVLEIIQFKTINGTKLPKLKMIWAAINPPGSDYQVEELDPALVDRFHCYIPLQPEVSLEYLSTKMEKNISLALKTWWDTMLTTDQKRIFTPRRIEYVGFMIQNDLDWRSAVPQGYQFPLEDLNKRIKKIKNNIDLELEIEPTKENILTKQNYFIDKVNKDPKFFSILIEIIIRFDRNELYAIRDLLECFPSDLLTERVIKRKMPGYKEQLLDFFRNDKIDMKKYPKIYKALTED